MANASEICTVTAGGQKYTNWETVEVHKSASDVIDHCMLTVSEPSTGGTGLAALKLVPGDSASVTLGGAKAINGMVYLRQAAADANTHAVQIGIASNAQKVMRTTVDGANTSIRPFSRSARPASARSASASTWSAIHPALTLRLRACPKRSARPVSRSSKTCAACATCT
jgi:hypothetical protein